ncbi:single-stranded DNA-binding protein [Fusobacterium vincentii]|uniref:single-stranded DNA-binding protein n=1 Tax=Fusobacterium vincentii TaxID=155615 RepID=UPI00324D1918
MNIVILKGRLTKDVSLLFGQSGTPYTSFTVAVNRYSKDKDLTDFILCTAFKKTAEFISEYFRKGQEILIKGNVKVDSYEKDGNKITRQYIIVENVEFVGSKKEDENSTKDNSEVTVDNIDDEFPF